MCAELRVLYPIRSLFIVLVRMYQLLVSPFLPGSCRFIPSCSEYAIEALATHGLFRGLGLTLWRILRCHPLTPGGNDPVPDRRPITTHGEEQERTKHVVSCVRGSCQSLTGFQTQSPTSDS